MPSPSPSRRQRCVGVTARRLPPQDQWRILQEPCTLPLVGHATPCPPTSALRWTLAPAHPRGPVPPIAHLDRPSSPQTSLRRPPRCPRSFFPSPLAVNFSCLFLLSFFPSFLLTPTQSLTRTHGLFFLHSTSVYLFTFIFFFFRFFFSLAHANQPKRNPKR